MASYSAARAKHATLATGVEDIVTLTNEYARVEVLNRGTGDIFLTLDNTAATVSGDNTFVVPSNGVGSFLNPTPSQQGVEAVVGQTIVRLIATGTPAYSVTGA